MGRPRSEDITTATPARLLAAAEVEFAAAGYGGTTLAKVAERAGIRRSSLLYPFPSKKELYTATVRSAFARLGAALQRAMQAPGVFERRMIGVIRGYASFMDMHPNIAKIVARELIDGNGPGGDLLLAQAVPRLAEIARVVREHGRAQVRRDSPVRAAVLALAGDLLLRAASGQLRVPLWGEEDQAERLCRALLLPS